MGAVERFCDRAMLIERGRDGRDRRAARDRARLQRAQLRPARARRRRAATATATRRRRDRRRVVRDASGERVTALAQGEPLHDRACEVALPRADRGPDLRASRCATSRGTPCSPPRRHGAASTTGRFAAGDDVERPHRASTTGSRRAATRSRRRSRAPARGADALDLREDLASLVVHGTRVTGGIVDLPHTHRGRAPMTHRRRSAAPRRRPSATRARSGSLTWTLAVTDWKLRFYGSVLGYAVDARAAVRVLRRHLLRVHRDRDVGDDVKNYARLHPVRARAVPVLRRDRRAACVQSLVDAREPAAQDALPAARDPAVGRRSSALFNLGMTLVAVFVFALAHGVYPTWSWLELSRWSRCSTLLATGVGMLLSRAVRALPRHAADLGGRRADAVLRLAGALRRDDGAGGVPARVPRSTRSRRSSPRCATRSSTRPRRPRPTAIGGAGAAADPARDRRRPRSRSGLWVFIREAPADRGEPVSYPRRPMSTDRAGRARGAARARRRARARARRAGRRARTPRSPRRRTASTGSTAGTSTSTR